MTYQDLQKARYAADTVPDMMLIDMMLDKSLSERERQIGKVAFWLSNERYWINQGKAGVQECKRINRNVRLGLNSYNW